MIKTLYKYLGRDLARVTALSLAAFTVVLTVFAIIEPLRKEGLDGRQVLGLFVFTIPMMLSLTLPIAALFSACIVYGRFSQDNELLAGRASGIATTTLLRPALVLGIVVTLAVWSLSNNVTPYLTEAATRTVKANVRGIIYRRLATRGHVSEDMRVIHADRVIKDLDKIQGVVVVDCSKNKKEVALFAAQTAYARFDTDPRTGETYVSFQLINPVLVASDSPDIRRQHTGPIESVRIRNPLKEKPSWYSWTKLLATLSDPTRSAQVRRTLTKIRRSIRHDMFTRHVAEALKDYGKYDLPAHGETRYVIRAGKARARDAETLVLARTGGPGGPRPVEIIEVRDRRPVRMVTAAGGKIRTTWSPRAGGTVVAIILDSDVVVRDLIGPDQRLMPRREWSQGQIPLPDNIRKAGEQITLKQVYRQGRQLTADHNIHKKLYYLETRQIDMQRNDIIAEMHGRVAFSISCVLLVMLGGALGLIFRGGQVIVAFATTVAPASAVFVTIIMGKKMVQNPDAPMAMGLGAIWSGIVLLGAATAWIYLYLARK